MSLALLTSQSRQIEGTSWNLYRLDLYFLHYNVMYSVLYNFLLQFIIYYAKRDFLRYYVIKKVRSF